MYKVGDKVVPFIGNYIDEVCTITEVEGRLNGGITVLLKDGRTGYLFPNEIRPAKEFERPKASEEIPSTMSEDARNLKNKINAGELYVTKTTELILKAVLGDTL